MISESSYLQNAYCSKIFPLSLHRKNIQNSFNAQKEILLRGNKYFSKISAIGETTQATLLTLVQCKKIKRLARFQFDAYLCEKSCLRDLCKAFKRIQRLKDLNIVFRRLDKMNESKIITPFVKKQVSLRKLRLELPKTINIDDRGIINFAKMLGKCVLLEYYEEVIVCLENVSAPAYSILSKYCHKNIYIKDLRMASAKMGNLNNSQACGLYPGTINPRPNNRLKKITMQSGVKTGWFSLSSDWNNPTIATLKNFGVPKNLESLTGKFNGVPSIDEVIAIFEAVTKLPGLTCFGLEFSNCRMTDLEVFSICQLLNKSRQIKEFTLKVIQYPNISKDCIFYLLRTLIQLQNLTKFNVYIRRLSLDEMEINELLESISYLPGLECVCFQKQSLHVYKSIVSG